MPTTDLSSILPIPVPMDQVPSIAEFIIGKATGSETWGKLASIALQLVFAQQQSEDPRIDELLQQMRQVQKSLDQIQHELTLIRDAMKQGFDQLLAAVRESEYSVLAAHLDTIIADGVSANLMLEKVGNMATQGAKPDELQNMLDRFKVFVESNILGKNTQVLRALVPLDPLADGIYKAAWKMLRAQQAADLANPVFLNVQTSGAMNQAIDYWQSQVFTIWIAQVNYYVLTGSSKEEIKYEADLIVQGHQNAQYGLEAQQRMRPKMVPFKNVDPARGTVGGPAVVDPMSSLLWTNLGQSTGGVSMAEPHHGLELSAPSDWTVWNLFHNDLLLGEYSKLFAAAPDVFPSSGDDPWWGPTEWDDGDVTYIFIPNKLVCSASCGGYTGYKPVGDKRAWNLLVGWVNPADYQLRAPSFSPDVSSIATPDKRDPQLQHS